MDYKQKLELLEKKYLENKTIKNALLLVQKYRTAYKFFNNFIYVKKALVIIKERMAENSLDARLILYRSYFAYLEGNIYESKSYLKVIKQGKNYYKENDKELYIFYLYVSGLVEQRDKYIKLLSKFIVDNKIVSCYIADLYLEDVEYNMCYKYLKEGNNSPLFFEIMYKYFDDNKEVEDNKGLLSRLLRWCYYHNISVSSLLTKQGKNISNQIKDNISLFTKIYYQHEEDYILEKLCQALIKKEETSKDSFLLYLKAAKKQISLKNLNKMLILSSYKNNYENISYFFMKNFLLEEKLTSEIKGFIFHLLIIKENLNQLLEENNLLIVEHSIYGVDNGLTDIYNLSVYRYCLLNQKKFLIEKNYVNKMEAILFENLFNYKVHVNNKFIRYVAIKEYEKKDLIFFPIENQEGTVKTSTSEFSYYFFDDSKNNMIKEIPVFYPMVYSLDISIYIYFYNRGKRTPELLISCSNYCLNNSINEDEILHILEDTGGLKNLTTEYINKINLLMASIYLNKKEYKKALEYFNKINYSKLSGDYIEKLLIVLLETKNYKKASDLLLLKRQKISQGVIIYALEKLLTQDELKKNRGLVSISFEMIKKGSLNLQLINLVLSEYETTLDELLSFYKIINKKNIFNKTLAEKIIISTIKNRFINEEIENIFVKLYKQINLEKSTTLFIDYLSYEVIKNGYVVSEEVLKILEEVYSYNKITLMTLAISYYYKKVKNYDIIKQGINEMEKEKILFPVFKEEFFSCCGDYVNKFQPFIYHSEKNKQVYFNFKFKEEVTFKKVEMEYFKFGLFVKKIVLFYNEEIDYYFEEVHDSGSITTDIKKFKNKQNKLRDTTSEYTVINNACIYKEKFKYNEVENIIISLLNNQINLVGQLMEDE